MEKHDYRLGIAIQKLNIADHMLTVTFPLVKDTKLLIAIIENVFLSFTNGITANLLYERYYKKIPPFNPTFDSIVYMYQTLCQNKFELDKEYITILKEIKNIVHEHKKSPVEFSRNNTYVICSENCSTMIITQKKLKEYISKAKFFIQEINSIISKNDRHTKRSSKRIETL